MGAASHRPHASSLRPSGAVSPRTLWLENAFLTTTATQLGRGKPAGGVRRYRDNGDGLSNSGSTEIQG